VHDRRSQGHYCYDSRAFSWLTVNDDGPAQTFRPFSHTDQAEAAFGIRHSNRPKPTAIVVDTQLDMLFSAKQFNVNLGGF
jgi:hypothetical protein